LDQLAREPCNLLLPELEDSLRLLQHGTPMCFLPRHAFVLEGGSSLLKSGLLLLQPSFCLLACTPLLLELLLHRGERGNLVHLVGPQLLGLLGLLLGLALPRLRPLEGCAVLLELGSSQSGFRLPLRHYNPHRGQVLARLPQHLIPLQERRRHLVNRGGVCHSMDALA
jgi:hypothetical protein